MPVALLTEIRMFEYVPMFLPVGPSSSPVYTENLAHAGLLTMEKRSVDALTLGSLAVGLKLYQELLPNVVFGVPEIVGAASAAPPGKVSAQTLAKKKASAPKTGARMIEVRMDNPRGYDTGAAPLRTRYSAHPHLRSAVLPDSSVVGHRMHEAA